MKSRREPSIHRYQDQNEFVRACVEATRTSLLAVLDTQPHATLAVPGGRTMAEILPALAASDLPWKRIAITLVDERWVAPGHPASNETQVRTLLGGVASQAAFHGLYVEGAQPEDAVNTLEQTIPRSDVILLAMGDDGHIGSLFPGAPATPEKRRYVAVHRDDYSRITLTYAALEAARSVILPLRDAAKERILDAALSDDARGDLPVRHALRCGAQVFIGPA